MRIKSQSHRRRQPESSEGPSTPPHDESNWLVSYADMMTLLFGFFVLMYSLTRFDGSKFDLVRKEIAKYFGGNIKEISALVQVEQKLMQVLKGSGELNGVEISKGQDNQVLLTFEGDILFAPGQIELHEKARPLLKKAVSLLRSVGVIEQIEVEGHTDVDPISTPAIASNWELSALRAGSVVRYFESVGLDSSILKATGRSDTAPAQPHRDEKRQIIEAHKAKNRRVVLAVKVSDPEAAFQLQQKDFRKVLTPQEKADLQKKQELEDQLKLAQSRYEESQRRLKLKQEEKKRKAQLERLERQIEVMNQKVKDVQEQAEESSTP